MNDKIKSALLRLAGDDIEAVDDLLAKVEGANRTIADRGLITRKGSPGKIRLTLSPDAKAKARERKEENERAQERRERQAAKEGRRSILDIDLDQLPLRPEKRQRLEHAKQIAWLTGGEHEDGQSVATSTLEAMTKAGRDRRKRRDEWIDEMRGN